MSVIRASVFMLALAFAACGDDERADRDTSETSDIGTSPDTSAPDASSEDAATDTTPTDTAAPLDVPSDTITEIAADDTRGDAADGDVDWRDTFDVAALLEGARSEVPDEVMARWPALLGGPMHRRTALYGVEFHIPGVVSSAAMSPVPIPVRKEENGVAFWQISGELSARVQDDWCIDFAIGPIDADGVNHRDEAYDPFEPSEAAPDDARSHPRAALPGAIFYVRWPVTGWNGALVQMQPAADAGNGYPQALLAWWPVDPIALLHEGYAVASVAAGGTVYGRKDEDGAIVVDTNPESGSDIFYTIDPELAAWDDVYETEHTKLVSAMRPVRVDEATLEETAHPVVTEVELVFPGYDAETDTWFEDRFTDNVTHPDRPFPIAFYGVELVSDAVVFFKNLLAQATGEPSPWAVYLGWSGSGQTAWSIATGTQSSGGFQFEEALGVPPSGGNFRTWRDPSSGVRFDAFLVFGSARAAPVFVDGDSLEDVTGHAWVDAEYPLGAPYVWVRGDSDVLLGDRGDDFWANAFIQSNAVARAWAGSELAARSLDDFMAIYEVAKLNHQSRDQLFPMWDRPPIEGAVWYDPAGGYDAAALNTEGRGLRLSEVYARQVRAYGDEIQYYASDLHGTPRATPLMVALIAALRASTDEGAPLPTSRVGPLLASVEALDASTTLPPYPAPCDDLDGGDWDELLACRDALEADGTWTHRTLLDLEVAAVHEFVTDNPLSRVAERVILPDVAAPLGYFFAAYGVMLRADFDDDELATRYVDHAGYVAAVQAATDALALAGLWDASLGAIYVDDAVRSGVLDE